MIFRLLTRYMCLASSAVLLQRLHHLRLIGLSCLPWMVKVSKEEQAMAIAIEDKFCKLIWTGSCSAMALLGDDSAYAARVATSRTRGPDCHVWGVCSTKIFGDKPV